MSPSFDGLSTVARVERSPVAAPRRGVLRHPGPGSGRAPDHAAPPHRRTRRGLASQAARRRRTPGPRSARRWTTGVRRHGARRAARRRAGHRARPAAGARWRASRPTAPSTCCTAPTGTALAEFCDDRSRASAGERRRAAGVAGVGARTRRGRRSDGARSAGPAGQPTVRRGRRARRARLEAGAGAAARAADARRRRDRSRSGAPRRRRAGRANCWCGTARCGPTPGTRCTRCG